MFIVTEYAALKEQEKEGKLQQYQMQEDRLSKHRIRTGKYI